MRLRLSALAVCLLIVIPSPSVCDDDYGSGNVTFDPQGLGPWFDGINAVLDSVIGKDALPPNFIKINNHTIEIAEDVMDILPEVLKHYVALLIIVIVGLLLAIITPIVGFCFCACRCCGNCGGGKSQPYDKENESCCGPFILITFLLIICAALTFGAVVTFVTNDRLEDGIQKATNTVHIIVDDSTLYLKNTADDFHSTLIDSFNELSEDILKKIQDSPETISGELETISKAVSLKELMNVAEELPKIKTSLENMDRLTTGLKDDITNVKNTLEGVKRNLKNPLDNCGGRCADIKKQVDKLDIAIDLDNLENTQNVVQDLDNVKDLQTQVNKGLESLENIKTSFERAINDNIRPIEDSITDAEKEIDKQWESLNLSLGDLRETISNQTEIALNTVDQYIDEYSSPRYYVCLALCLILLIVAICVACGLLCGTFGKRKHNRNDCGTKDVGGALLMCVVGILFIVTLIFALAVLAQFIVGLVVHRAVCVPLRNPADDQIFGLISELLDINKILNANAVEDSFNLSTIIDNCHKDKSAYEVFQLENVLGKDITELDKYLDIDQYLDEIIENFKIPSDIEIMNDEIRQDFQTLKESKLGTFPFKDYTDELSKDITKVDLVKLANELDDISQTLPQNVGNDLREQAQILKNCQENDIKPMISKTGSLKKIAGDLETSIKFNKDSFTVAISDLEEELEKAQEYINNEASDFVKDTITDFGTTITETIKYYLSGTIDDIKNNLGKCGPMSNAYNATLVTVCDSILDPFNGFWAGLGWSVLLFIPCIIFCTKLATHYRKYDPGFQVFPGAKAGKKKQKYQRNQHVPNQEPQMNTSQMPPNPNYAAYDNRAYTGERSPKNVDPLENRWVSYAGPNTQQPIPQIENRWTTYAGNSPNSDPLANRYARYSGNPGQTPHLRNTGHNSNPVDNRWTQYEGSHHM